MSLDHELRLVAVMRSEEGGADLRAACTGLNGTKIDIRVASIEEVAQSTGLVNGHDVLLLDVDPCRAEETEALEKIVQGLASKAPIVVTAAQPTLEDIRRLMSMGVVDVLPQPIRDADLMIALDHATRNKAKSEPVAAQGGKIVSFVKGGGGAGATSLAVQSGCVLAEQLRAKEGKVCLLDLDIQFGTAGLYLDLEAQASLLDLVETPERLDRSLLRGVMTRHHSGLEVLPAPPEVIPHEAITPEFIIRCLELACAEYDYVLVDLPSAWTSWSYAVLCESDLILLVTQLGVSGVRQAVRQLETIRSQEGIAAPIKFVLNRHNKPTLGKPTRIKYAEKALGRPFDYFIANDYQLLSEAIDRGVALSEIKGRSRVGKSIAAMTSDIVRSLETAAEAARVAR